MIVKLGEPLEWQTYRSKSENVKAIRLREDFLYETAHGWVKGFKGQWLVESSERVRNNLDHEAFLRAYSDERRKGDAVNDPQ